MGCPWMLTQNDTMGKKKKKKNNLGIFHKSNGVCVTSNSSSLGERTPLLRENEKLITEEQNVGTVTTV